ncbi:MAG: hypothetical protein IJN63_03625 [Clostridia bacterium]|nr:hypothetical protein [Clostridia bacterium]
MKKLLAVFLISILAFAVLCSCGEDNGVNDSQSNNDGTVDSGDPVEDIKLPDVDIKTGKINIDEPIVPVELHTNSYLYTVLTYNEDGDVIGETTYNTRFDTEFKTTYEYVKNADGTMLVYSYSDNSGNIYEYDANGFCIKSTYYSIRTEKQKTKDEIFAEDNRGSSVTYQYDSIGRVTSRTAYTDKGEAELTTSYTYNDENLVLTKITTYPNGDAYETLEFSLNDNGDYSQLHMISVFWKSDTVTPFEWSYATNDDLLYKKTMLDERTKKIVFEYEYDDNGSLERIKYYHGYEIVPVQYFLGEGALMDSTDLAADVVFMPLSKALAKQSQN